MSPSHVGPIVSGGYKADGLQGSYVVDHGLDLWDHVTQYQVGGRLVYRVVVFDDEDDAGFVVRVPDGVWLVVVHPIRDRI